ncbi:hypothetical protein GALMADRAFT_243475 [Galerina marginata CBS 339.88]|uniref:Uncharacterized protein n=1 Tax=Galerina marginata (strain CBS 339.88) TaxID=685588 RepID=A0A067T893_GALM3|nr:hypothetical protein GALMADRAFT_243475 [Galerina marginata CBS 339.88]
MTQQPLSVQLLRRAHVPPTTTELKDSSLGDVPHHSEYILRAFVVRTRYTICLCLHVMPINWIRKSLSSSSRLASGHVPSPKAALEVHTLLLVGTREGEDEKPNGTRGSKAWVETTREHP